MSYTPLHVCQAQILVPGSENGAFEPIPLTGLVPGSFALGFAADGVPHTAAALSGFSAQVNTPQFAGGSLFLNYAEFCVSNAAGTEKKIVATQTPQALTADEHHAVTAFTGTIETIGADLNLVGDSIVSTAGGQFYAYLLVYIDFSQLTP